MPKSLFIVESPAKARTLKKYLGPDFEVMASVGHVVDLPRSRLGVDLTHDFTPEYEVIKGKETVVKDLKKAAGRAQEIYLAPDPDREGEAIAWHIADQLGGPTDRFHRVLFHELTKSAILKAVANPLTLNRPRYDSQQARRVLDRLVGYQISPILWDKVKRGLSAGRVQSVALRLVVERERIIVAFVPQEYWTVTARLKAGEPPLFAARLARLDEAKFDPKDEAQALAGVNALEGQTFSVTKVVTRERRQHPQPPFITSTLQQEASRKLGLTPKDTMSIAQRLYEGMETDQGQVGLITYMRTDSTRLAEEALAEVRQLIATRFGPEYLPDKPHVYRSKEQAQEAHEAIRPTSAFRTPESLQPYLRPRDLGLYRLIYNRFLACQMAPAVYDQTLADISAGSGLLKASGQVQRFKGFTALYVEDKDEAAKGQSETNDSGSGEETVAEGVLPPLKEGQVLSMKDVTPKQHFTQPPPRFTEAALVKELEERGIGRPSTYAAILSTLEDKEYVAKAEGEKVSRARRHLVPTPLGSVVSDLLVENFPLIMEVDFTAGLEKALDQVEEGKQDWRKLLKEFYEPFAKALKAAGKNMRQIKGKGIPTDLKCPACAKPLSIRLGKHGEFLACDGYPDCSFTADFARDEQGRIVVDKPEDIEGVDCPQCGAPMRLKKGKLGPFLACSAYPKCKTTSDFTRDEQGKVHLARPEMAEGEVCEKCGAPMLVKKGRTGPYLACSAYPKCKNIRSMNGSGQGSAALPAAEQMDEKCPRCEGQLAIKPTRAGGRFISCTNYPKCRYSRGLPVETPCPKCGGQVAEKRSHRGKTFYGCMNYPQCDFVSWDRPEPGPCPTCGHPYLVKKVLRGGPPLVRCPQKECGFQRDAQE